MAEGIESVAIAAVESSPKVAYEIEQRSPVAGDKQQVGYTAPMRLHRSGRPAYKNRYQIEGDVAAIWIRGPKGVQLKCLIDAEDFPMVYSLSTSWRGYWSEGSKTYYVHTVILLKRFSLHRLVMNAPHELEVDHIFHNGLDNRKSQLRIATRQQNALNRRGAASNSQTGHRGICPEKSGKFLVYVRDLNHARSELGRYSTLSEAIVAQCAYYLHQNKCAEKEATK